jgi:uncharacterized protein (DUF1499 family)
MMMILWGVLIIVVAGLAYVRLAPSDPAQWNIAPEVSENKTFKSGVKRLIVAGPDGLARLDKIIMATPRTQVLAGSVTKGMVTYVTRSLVFGFPDYTTVQQDAGSLKIYARQRFGRSDIGVNKARVEAWINALQL